MKKVFFRCTDCWSNDPHKHHPTCSHKNFFTNDPNFGRTFSTGAYRDTDENKLDYSRGLSPEVMERYMTYLMVNRKQSNGEMRDFDNWKQGIPVEEYMASLFRHVTDVWKYVQGKHCEPPESSLEESLCAVMFNSMGMLYEVMQKPADSVKEK